VVSYLAGVMEVSLVIVLCCLLELSLVGPISRPDEVFRSVARLSVIQESHTGGLDPSGAIEP